MDLALLLTGLSISAIMLKGVSIIGTTGFRVGRQLEELNHTIHSLTESVEGLKEYDRNLDYRLTDVENWLQKNTAFEKRHQ